MEKSLIKAEKKDQRLKLGNHKSTQQNKNTLQFKWMKNLSYTFLDKLYI